MSIGKRLAKVRQDTGLSQGKYAEKFGLSDRAYKNYELEIRDLPIAVALAISKNENVNIQWLLTGQGTRHDSELHEAISAAIFAFREASDPLIDRPTPEQEAAIVVFLVEMILNNGGLDEKVTQSYFKSVNWGSMK